MKKIDKSVREYLRGIAAKGGAARAEKFDAKTLSAWGKMGGRPKKKGPKKNGESRSEG